MTLASKLRRKLSEAKPALVRHDLGVVDEVSGWNLYLTAERRDEWSTVAWELTLRRSAVAGIVADWAERIAKKNTGLLEPLKVVEVDAPRNEALIRSAVPSERDGRLFYYELRLEGAGAATLRRFEAASEPGHKRCQVPFALTIEALVQFVGAVTTEN